MELVLPLNEMTLAAKLQMMEQLWDELCRDPQSIPSPQWHGDTLKARAKQVEQGMGRFADWQQAKQQIRDSAK